MNENYVVVISKARIPTYWGELTPGNTFWVTECGSTADFPQGRVKYVESVHDLNAVEAAVAHFVAEYHVVGALSPFETGYPATAYARTRLGLPGPDLTQTLCFTDKFRMKRMFAGAELPHTRFLLAATAARVREQLQAFGRLVLKPRFGGGTFGVVMLHTQMPNDEVDRIVEEQPYPVLVEKAVDIVCEYHVDTWVVDGRSCSVIGKYLEPALESARAQIGYGSVMLDSSDPHWNALRDLDRRLVMESGVRNGVLHTEYFLTSEGRIIVSESAMRPGGGGIVRGVQLATGVDLFDIHFAASIGARPTNTKWHEPHQLVGHLALPFAGLTQAQRRALTQIQGVIEITASPTMQPQIFLAGTNGGFVYVSAESPQDLEEKLRQCRKIVNESAG